jgi:hypothetical protein
MSNNHDRLKKLEEQTAATTPIPECECSGDDGGVHWVIPSADGRSLLCDTCKGRLPAGFVVVAPPGTVPSHPDHPDEPVILSVVPDNE